MEVLAGAQPEAALLLRLLTAVGQEQSAERVTIRADR